MKKNHNPFDMPSRRYALIIAMIALISCGEEIDKTSGEFGKDTAISRMEGFSGSLEFGNKSNVHSLSIEQIGTDEFVGRKDSSTGDRRTEIVVANNNSVELSLIDASIVAASKAVLSDTLGLKYVIANDVTGRISLQTTGAVPKSALLELFEAALNANGATLENEKGIVRIVNGTSGNQGFRLARNGIGSGSNIIVAPLRFISASEMVGLLNDMPNETLTTIADHNRNLILMSGSRVELEAAIDALNLFDIDVLRGKSIALVQLNSADPEDLVSELQVIFDTEENGLLRNVVEFVPNSRLGSILVISKNSEYLARAKKWIRQLDRSASKNQRYSQTYKLQNRSASDVAPLFNELLNESDTSDEKNALLENTGQSKVVADDARNSLLVRAFREEHDEISILLKDLDNSPRQVMIEATIAEVILNDEVSLGLRWYFEEGNFAYSFTDSTSGSTGPNYPGFSAVFSSGSAHAALNALAGVTDVKIVSSPTLMVRNNKEAILQIGDQVPIATQTSVETGSVTAPIVSQIDYRDTGVILKVNPRIGAGGRVILDIDQEISDVSQTSTSGIDSPTIRQRQIKTSVALADGATLALGGLVQEGDNKIESKVPGLGDIPVLGAAFRTKSQSKKRTELLILIRPRVVETANEAQSVTSQWRNKLSAANSSLQTGLGSPRHTVSDLFD
ncbi:MAG: type II secretion system secretin GspD [Pseudoruegeria sp.]